MGIQALPALRPLQLGELLDRAFRLYRGNFLTFLGIIAVAYVPLMVVLIGVSELLDRFVFAVFSGSLETFAHILLYSLVLVQSILVQGIATGALTRAVADRYLGRKTGILAAYRASSQSWLSLAGALLVLGIVTAGLLLWLLIPLIGWLTGLGMVLFVVSVVSRILPSAVILENQSAVAAVKRAWSLARRRFWPMLGYASILFLFGMIVQMGVTAIVGGILSILSLGWFFERITSLVFVLIYYPLQMTAFTLVYFDLRIRTEGFDLALLTIEAPGSMDLSQVLIPLPQEKERLITASELGYFAIRIG